MATIKQRGTSFFITVSCGRDTSGKQVRQTMTYKPDENMNARQIEKEVQRQAILFEESCKQGQKITAAIKFEAYARQWFTEYAEIKLKAQTLNNYHLAEKRIYKAIGHLKLDKVTPRHIQSFILELNEAGLAPKTIKNYVYLISSIYNYAVKMQQISFNPCENVTIPRQEQKDKEIYTPEETQEFLNLLSMADGKDLKFAIFFTLAIFTGFRRGEVLGLEWKDINEETRIISVNRASYWTKERGTYTDTPKTRTSRRSVKVPEEVIAFLKCFREYQNKQKSKLGDKWVEHDRLFTGWNGFPMNPNSPNAWFKKYSTKHGLKYVNVHSWRHFNASILIFNRIDLETIKSHLGHSTALTTLSIYSHEINAAKAAASEAITSVISFKSLNPV
jgi:integrase